MSRPHAAVDKVEGQVVELRQLTEFFKEKVQSDPVTRDDLLQFPSRYHAPAW